MYKQISPAEGWYFVGKGVPATPLIVFPIAAWALTEKGDAVVGLVGDVLNGGADQGHRAEDYRAVAHLISVPPIPGMYRHESCLTAEERAAALKG